MIEDDVIRGVRAAREEFAQRHGYNIRAMVSDLQAQDDAGDWPVVSHAARRPYSTNSPYKPLPAVAPAMPTLPSIPTTAPSAAAQ